jgi:CHASE3 domain sensor protein
LIAVLVIALLSYQSLQVSVAASKTLTQSIEVLAQLNNVLSTLKDAETGRRGFLLTGNESYLEPFLTAKAALPSEFATMRGLMANRSEQMRRLDVLESIAAQKMSELSETINVRHAGQVDAALAVVRSDRGKNYMDRIRAAVVEMDGVERRQTADQPWTSTPATTMRRRSGFNCRARSVDLLGEPESGLALLIEPQAQQG